MARRKVPPKTKKAGGKSKAKKAAIRGLKRQGKRGFPEEVVRERYAEIEDRYVASGPKVLKRAKRMAQIVMATEVCLNRLGIIDKAKRGRVKEIMLDRIERSDGVAGLGRKIRSQPDIRLKGARSRLIKELGGRIRYYRFFPKFEYQMRRLDPEKIKA